VERRPGWEGLKRELLFSITCRNPVVGKRWGPKGEIILGAGRGTRLDTYGRSAVGTRYGAICGGKYKEKIWGTPFVAETGERRRKAITSGGRGVSKHDRVMIDNDALACG